MFAADLPCAPPGALTRPIHAVRPASLGACMGALAPAQQNYVTDCGFAARAQEFVLIPGEGGVVAALLGIGEDRSPHVFGDLPFKLPLGDWHFEAGDFEAGAAVLGFCLGAYRYAGFKAPKRASARLAVPAGFERALSEATSAWMVRDLINAPANLLGPAELADAGLALGEQFGAACERIEGEPLAREYPTIAAVGRGSARAPVVARFRWRGRSATDSSPLVSLCGKGVCFDTGGYDLKPSAGMLRMKKDMGGAAAIMGIARTLMDADAPLRLEVRLGCVENSVSGTAMRPLDVVRTRRGHSVEIGNTDAEGRLVLCDLIAEASDAAPAIVLDCATLTGAARVALGPDLPALFANDEGWAESILHGGRQMFDPLWRLPLWDGYDSWLDSNVADLNNVSSKAFAGAITAALFLRRFVAPGVPWAHIDLYAWNDTAKPGRPEGGEAQAIRAICYGLINKLSAI